MLVKKIMKDENIPLANVLQNNYWSGKNCPKIMRDGGGASWAEFKSMLVSSIVASNKDKDKECVRMHKPVMMIG
ncbi:hypothetical protein [Bacillus sp. JJ722]|uniref:hypothetical protein n=1 Tax=Bacillus sp. JJ722 TaxID=3122973 RepID=UPI003000E94E